MPQEQHLKQLYENLLFTHIFKTFRMAIQPSKLIIAFLAITVWCLLGILMDVNKTVVTSSHVSATDIGSMPVSELSDFPTELHCFIAAPDQVRTFRDRYDGRGNRIGVFDTLSRFCNSRFNNAVTELLSFNFTGAFRHLSMCVYAVGWAFRWHPIYSIIFYAAFVVIFAVAGGAICRMAALQLARDERPGVVQGLQFARNKLKHFILAPLTPFAIMMILGFFIFILGLLGNIPYAGELLVSLLLIFAMIIGFLIVLLLVGTLGGLPLMFPAIAYEGTDSFEAINRSFSHVYARPWRMIFYTLVAAIYGAACYVFVRIFIFLLLSITYGFIWLGLRARVWGVNKLEVIWPKPNSVTLFGAAQLSWTEGISTFLISIVVLIVFCCAAAFVISFFYSASTIIYALMRKKVDNTPIEEIYIDSEDKKPLSYDQLPTEV